MGHLSDIKLRQLYNHDYFSGISSGYPKSGYQQSHPDWMPWLDLIELIQPSGTLVDLGCAFGYLVKEARKRSYLAFGLDISSYALTQEPEISGLVKADIQKLPLRSASFDIVALFDVLEHLTQPHLALTETLRILKPEGLVIGTTPDPIFFTREEPTHIFERPPSYWIELLQRNGFEIRFRFSEESYNFQFVASPAGSTISAKLDLFQHDYFSFDRDIIETKGPLLAVPRGGWGRLNKKRRRIQGQGSIYLLNPSPNPLHTEISCGIFNPSSCVTVRIRFNSLILEERVLTPEQPVKQKLNLPPLEIPAGGHHLWFEVEPSSSKVSVEGISIKSSEGNPLQLTQSLPFDLFQRYQLASQICSLLQPTSILDVGGYLGDEGGHLATVQDFLSTVLPLESLDKVCSTDIRQGDWPTHQPASAKSQPYEDGSFDLVISLDLLEHLPTQDRPAFLQELSRLARRWILLAAPFASSEVDEAEKSLCDSLLSSHRFLQEHRDLGLPHLDVVTDHYQKQGYLVEILPNGFLERWKVMQVLTSLYFSHHDWVSLRNLNQLYNRSVFSQDQLEPAYRHHLLISKEPLPAETAKDLAALRTNPRLKFHGYSPFDQNDFTQLNQRILDRLETVSKNLLDTQFLFGERQKLISLMETDLENTRKNLEKIHATPLYRLVLKRIRQRLGVMKTRYKFSGK